MLLCCVFENASILLQSWFTKIAGLTILDSHKVLKTLNFILHLSYKRKFTKEIRSTLHVHFW